MVPNIVRIVFTLVALLMASVCVAQSPKVEIVPMKIGGVDVAFGLEADEVGVVPQAEGATAYVQAVMGKQTRFTQCFFVLDAAYRKKMLSTHCLHFCTFAQALGRFALLHLNCGLPSSETP